MKVTTTLSFRQGLSIALRLPNAATSLADAPRLDLKLERIKLGTQAVPDTLWRHTVSKIGIYVADNPLEILENASIFRAENAQLLLSGGYAKDGWLPYNLTVTPTALCVGYYYIRDPRKRGLIELGKNFSQLWINAEAPSGQVDVMLRSDYQVVGNWAHSGWAAHSEQFRRWDISILRIMATEPKFWYFGRRQFVSGIANIDCRSHEDGEVRTIYSYNLSGRDTDPSHFTDLDPNIIELANQTD